MSDVELDLDDDNYFGDYYTKSGIIQDAKSNKNDDDEFPIEVLGPQVARGQRVVDNGLRQNNDDRPTTDN